MGLNIKRKTGGGRKPKPYKKMAYSTKLRPDQVSFLKQCSNAAKLIEKALDIYITLYSHD